MAAGSLILSELAKHTYQGSYRKSKPMTSVNSHYAVICFSGDPAEEHEDEELRGRPPHLDMIACGPEKYCIDSLFARTAKHPLRTWEKAEILTRDIIFGLAPGQLPAPR